MLLICRLYRILHTKDDQELGCIIAIVIGQNVSGRCMRYIRVQVKTQLSTHSRKLCLA